MARDSRSSDLKIFWEGGSEETRRRLSETPGLSWADSPESADLLVRSPVSASGELTPREIEVLEYLVDGWSNEEIASRLRIGVRTVRFHLDRIYRKWGVSRRTEAVREALTRGYARL